MQIVWHEFHGRVTDVLGRWYRRAKIGLLGGSCWLTPAYAPSVRSLIRNHWDTEENLKKWYGWLRSNQIAVMMTRYLARLRSLLCIKRTYVDWGAFGTTALQLKLCACAQAETSFNLCHERDSDSNNLRKLRCAMLLFFRLLEVFFR